eukprot:24123-Amphidinium_carterae.1
MGRIRIVWSKIWRVLALHFIEAHALAAWKSCFMLVLVIKLRFPRLSSDGQTSSCTVPARTLEALRSKIDSNHIPDTDHSSFRMSVERILLDVLPS